MEVKLLEGLFDEEDEPWSELKDDAEDDNSIDEEIWNKTFDMLSKYGHKWAEINALTHIWFYMTYGFEFGTDYEKSKNIEKMYKSAPMYFSISRIAIERTSRIELVKLFEGDDKASLRYLRKHISKYANKLCYRSKHISEVESLNKDCQKFICNKWDSIEALKEIRNKHLAHNDLEYFHQLESLYSGQKVIIQDVFDIINYTGNYLDKMAQLMQPKGTSASVCPKYNELMDIQSLEMYFRD